MRIALFSPFLSNNHGTVLQAFALSKVLRDKGHECEYIQSRLINPGVWNRMKFLLRHPLSVYWLHEYNNKRKKDLKYQFLQNDDSRYIYEENQKFCNRYTPVREGVVAYDDLSSLESQYDMFMVGSDQTWSPNAFYRYSPNYLSFIKNEGKKASYGSSMGTPNLPHGYLKFIKKRLSSFGSLSCRDRVNVSTLTKILRRKVTHVVDPTLLLNAEVWAQYAERIEGLPPEFILCYILGEKKCIIDYAESLGRKTGYPVYYIQTRPLDLDQSKIIKRVGAANFLWLIQHCTYMVTDSFHGTIFSINFNKLFYSFNKHYGNAVDNGRILDILKKFGLEKFFKADTDTTFEDEAPDYNRVNGILEDMRASSNTYLDEVLNNH